MFAPAKFRLGGHALRVETDRWLPNKPPREQRFCLRCHAGAVEAEQHFLACLTAISIVSSGISTFPCSLYLS